MVKNKNVTFIILSVYYSFYICMDVLFIIQDRYKNFAVSFIYMAIPVLFILFQRLLKIKIPTLLFALILFIAVGATLGFGLDFYSKISFYDDILHFSSGIIFPLVGFYLSGIFITGKGKKDFIGKLLFGFIFSLAIATLWELTEFLLTFLFNVDMQEDGIIYSIKSFYLSGSHNGLTKIDDITKTTINYGDGKIYALDGYLDVGLKDTLTDMADCFFGSIVYLIIFVFLKKRKEKAINYFDFYNV